MTLVHFIIGLCVNLLPPLVGLLGFTFLCISMRRANILSPPFISYLLLFVMYGGWLLVLLTSIFWKWSGMASLGVLFLVLVAPFVTAFLGWRLYQRRCLSRFHRAAFVASVSYTCVIILAVVAWWTLRFRKRTIVSVSTELRTSVFSVHGIKYEVTVLTGYASTVESEGFYDYRSDSLEFEEKHGDLTVNGKQFGRLKAGDAVKIDAHGTVSINGALRTPK